jgi:peptide/nickel transport system substrate-binding protein
VLRPPEPNPKRGGTLRTAWSVTTAHFDIHQGGNSGVMQMMYNSLVRKNLADGLRTVVPDLATRWEISPDGKTYTFSLRDGVKFHDGTPFTSADVVATFSRIIFPPQGMASILKAELSVVEKVEAVDPLTVRFVLQYPWPPFLEVLASPAEIIYPTKTLEANNNDLRKVIAPGTGAFVFKDHKAGERWIFARNPNYWDPELPYVDGLEMLHVPTENDRGTAVLTGQADMTYNSGPQPWEEGRKRSDIGAAQLSCLNCHTAMINNTVKPFSDARVRRAIHLAVSRPNMIKSLESQEPIFISRWMPNAAPYATPKDQIEKMPGYRPDKTPDIAEARRLMAEAGYPDGFEGVDLVTPQVPSWADVGAPALQDELKRTLNIRSKIRIVERGVLSEAYIKGDFGILLESAFSSSQIDPTVLWNKHLRSGASQNYSKYSNPEFDKLLDQINVESDESKRRALFTQGMDLLDQNPPFYLIGFCAHSPMWRSYVKGLAIEKRPYSQWTRLETVWLDK